MDAVGVSDGAAAVPPSTAGVWCPTWDGARYSVAHAHHRAFDGWFLSGWELGTGDRVLDIGCGDGAFTRQVAQMVPGGHVVGLDASESMLALARAGAGPNQSFVLGPVQRLDDLVGNRPRFDAVISRATLHWVPEADHPAVLAAVARRLRPGGLVRMEFGGGDNVAAVVALLDEISAALGGPRSPWTYLGPGRYLDLVEAAGLDVTNGWVRAVAQRRPFDRDGIWTWLTSQCLLAYGDGATAGFAAALEDSVAARLEELRRPDGSYDVTFVRLDVLARAP